MALGRNISRVLKAIGMTTAELARRAGLEENYRGLYAIQRRNTQKSEHLFKIAEALNIPADLLATGTDAEIDDWLAQRKEGGEASSEALRSPVAAPSIQAALPVVLEAMRACPHREELRTLMTLLIDIDAEPYRKRLLELLDTQSVPRPPAQTKRREDAAQEESPHATPSMGRTTGTR